VVRLTAGIEKKMDFEAFGVLQVRITPQNKTKQ
jgi:hypothetical protein